MKWYWRGPGQNTHPPWVASVARKRGFFVRYWLTNHYRRHNSRAGVCLCQTAPRAAYQLTMTARGGRDNACGRICAADRQWGSFNHVTDPHFATFSSSLHTTFGTINLLFYDTVHFFEYRGMLYYTWRFGVAVTRWSRSTQLLYIEPG